MAARIERAPRPGWPACAGGSMRCGSLAAPATAAGPDAPRLARASRRRSPVGRRGAAPARLLLL